MSSTLSASYWYIAQSPSTYLDPSVTTICIASCSKACSSIAPVSRSTKLGGAIGKTVKNLREGMGGGDKNIVEADDEEEVIEEVEEPVKKTTAAKKTTTAAKKKAE